MEAFYEQKAVPSPETEGSILVIQADDKVVPMVRDEPADPPARRGKGQKKTKKKESVVTAIYTVEPYVRTPEQMADALSPPRSRTGRGIETRCLSVTTANSCWQGSPSHDEGQGLCHRTPGPTSRLTGR